MSEEDYELQQALLMSLGNFSATDLAFTEPKEEKSMNKATNQNPIFVNDEIQIISEKPAKPKAKKTHSQFNNNPKKQNTRPKEKTELNLGKIFRNLEPKAIYDGKRFYLNNVLKKHNTKGKKHFISITDLVSPFVKSAILSTFTFDVEFLDRYFSHIQKIVLIEHWTKNQETQGRFNSNTKKIKRLEVIHPPLGKRFGCFHSKIMILEYPSFLRFVISSANLTNFDWYELGQVVWVQDFPRKSLSQEKEKEKEFEIEKKKRSSRSNYHEEMFLKTISHFFQKIGAADLMKNLKNFDFSKISVHLVLSVPGYYKVNSFNGKINSPLDYGLMSIQNIAKSFKKTSNSSDSINSKNNSNQNILKSLSNNETKKKNSKSNLKKRRMNNKNEIKKEKEKEKEKKKEKKKEKEKGEENVDKESQKIYFYHQTSSVGNYQRGNWIRDMPRLMAGLKPATEQEKRKRKRSNISQTGSKFPKLKIIFPSRRNIFKSKNLEGIDCLCFRDGAWDHKNFPKGLFYQCQPYDNNIILHSKVLIGKINKLEFLYIGSHNASQSAWGNLSKNFFHIANWEMGVIFIKQESKNWPDLLNNLPFKFPPTKYSQNDIPFCTEEFLKMAEKTVEYNSKK
ncbi:tyrosyl-DNA phosphodiesterase [Anaeramoeba flamelloides]|uniref:Tyrosyl-DNA phosphodiesterase n=1 Tax=Anaeramoeba flamelloides TaxID=1746091 RepID=A0AAV7Z4B2_9EUKA|nr:tyrosyl-DNA phosphodiesterase [Anaeramoeba flamelloides]